MYIPMINCSYQFVFECHQIRILQSLKVSLQVSWQPSQLMELIENYSNVYFMKIFFVV
jgi:hypothetical protein